MLQPVRIVTVALCFSAMSLLCGCGGTATDQASAGASTEDIKAFIEANPRYAETQDGIQAPDAAGGQPTGSTNPVPTSQPLDLGN